uniref:Uncharacterized protein n=1 Tax=Romanomermis culicivorax TaxID=13658 RepID=A0A915L5V7_ROMCU
MMWTSTTTVRNSTPWSTNNIKILKIKFSILQFFSKLKINVKNVNTVQGNIKTNSQTTKFCKLECSKSFSKEFVQFNEQWGRSQLDSQKTCKNHEKLHHLSNNLQKKI